MDMYGKVDKSECLFITYCLGDAQIIFFIKLDSSFMRCGLFLVYWPMISHWFAKDSLSEGDFVFSANILNIKLFCK